MVAFEVPKTISGRNDVDREVRGCQRVRGREHLPLSHAASTRYEPPLNVGPGSRGVAGPWAVRASRIGGDGIINDATQRRHVHVTDFRELDLLFRGLAGQLSVRDGRERTRDRTEDKRPKHP